MELGRKPTTDSVCSETGDDELEEFSHHLNAPRHQAGLLNFTGAAIRDSNPGDREWRAAERA